MSVTDIFRGIFDKKFDALGDRMKAYESRNKKYLEPKIPVIIRLDGQAFHTFTKRFQKPFDEVLIAAMKYTTVKLCENIQNVKLAYSQSDEITLFLSDYGGENTQQWFSGNVEKMVSSSASLATAHFNDYLNTHHWNKYPDKKKIATFDSRIFNVPRIEVVNQFIWRQQDAMRNSISALAQSIFSTKELHKKNTAQMLNMLSAINVYWDKMETFKKRGFCVTKEYYTIDPLELSLPEGIKPPENIKRSRWAVDDEIPIFSEDKSYIDILVMIGEIDNVFEEHEKNEVDSTE